MSDESDQFEEREEQRGRKCAWPYAKGVDYPVCNNILAKGNPGPYCRFHQQSAGSGDTSVLTAKPPRCGKKQLPDVKERVVRWVTGAVAVAYQVSREELLKKGRGQLSEARAIAALLLRRGGLKDGEVMRTLNIGAPQEATRLLVLQLRQSHEVRARLEKVERMVASYQRRTKSRAVPASP